MILNMLEKWQSSRGAPRNGIGTSNEAKVKAKKKLQTARARARERGQGGRKHFSLAQ